MNIMSLEDLLGQSQPKEPEFYVYPDERVALLNEMCSSLKQPRSFKVFELVIPRTGYCLEDMTGRYPAMVLQFVAPRTPSFNIADTNHLPVYLELQSFSFDMIVVFLGREGGKMVKLVPSALFERYDAALHGYPEKPDPSPAPDLTNPNTKQDEEPICAHCGSTATLKKLQSSTPRVTSCCPDRMMIPFWCLTLTPEQQDERKLTEEEVEAYYNNTPESEATEAPALHDTPQEPYVPGPTSADPSPPTEPVAESTQNSSLSVATSPPDVSTPSPTPTDLP